jgi:preprotein translocase subunit YajC
MWLETTDATANAAGSFWMAVLPFIVMFALLYFLIIRPQQKKQKERNAMLRSLQKGDRVVTIGGLHGTIESLTDDKVVLKVNDVTKLTFDRGAVNSVIARAEGKKSEKGEKGEKSEKSDN